MALYQCLILGSPTSEQAMTFSSTLDECLGLFGLERGREYTVDRGLPAHFNDATATVAIFFGALGSVYPEAPTMARLGVPVVPVISAAAHAGVELPPELRSINALIADPVDLALTRVVGAALQCLGLLPAQRRVFVSYRREESADVALQLFEALSARHFDVFLDTHSVSAAADFQAVLWHRLCDSDVLIMLDTPDYFNSRWTTQEWGKAIAKDISMLQLVWPGHEPSRHSRLATLKRLSADHFRGEKLTAETVTDIALEVERVRSVSVALRHANMVGTLRTAIEDLGGSVEGVGLKRSVVLRMPSGQPLVAYPVVGVPTSVDVQECIDLSDTRSAAVIYDHLGISNDWHRHLDWLAARVGNVKWLKRREAAWLLAEITH
ncbi:toll/interleukin-1 receptor domain-containing protein [Pandoraea capi]|uniref:toll/interleukin-1 receptor domain-containing protein n=1 Tax=Pandoraea TaxID=93217 RepID=UPI001F5C9FD3|nr:toll/interleukin-1 receptor domain-containing protein [Pandoraea capi]MCI3203860.1 TIR domain-containing protein [Pandoraea sp. LA3]MDN4581886.1 TIR domain-containing protein [Pandoraea capi]